MLKAIRKTRIYEEVVSQVHDLLREGRFKARDQLPSERELAETFKVSRTSVREALRALEAQGLIVSRTGAATSSQSCRSSRWWPRSRVCCSREGRAGGHFRGQEIDRAAYRVARRRARDERRYRAHEEDFGQAERDAVARGETGVEADAELHFAIARATQNRRSKARLGLMEILSHSREESLQTKDRRKASIESHRRILAAIEKHDKTKARDAMLKPHRKRRRQRSLRKKNAHIR
jgi:GntR family transcriptional repressor for pyruvate dehydrogenase complex